MFRNIPTLVKELCDIGQICCGASHTLALSKDGNTLWSFGDGSHGNLRLLGPSYPRVHQQIIYFIAMVICTCR